MKWTLIAGLAVALGSAGCVTYRVESKPQGLRVTVNQLEQGTTPCKVSRWIFWRDPIRTKITVYPPKSPQMEQYERDQQMAVSSWKRGEITKMLYSEHGSGTVLFDFVQDEHPSQTK
jgi:hypothetical protein